jgi:hypothetical protein
MRILDYTVNQVVNVTQSWDGINVTPFKLIPFTDSTAQEFINGEFSGSSIVATDGELNPLNPTKSPSTTILNYQVTGSNNTNPGMGEIYWNVGVPGGAPLFGTQYVDEIYIDEIDINGVNIEQALENLSPGDTITFPIQYQLPPLIPSPSIPIDKTVTGIITNISIAGNTIWRIRLAYSTGTNGTDVSYNPLTNNFAYDDTFGPVLLDPYINNVPNFNNSDFNAVINNAVLARVNPTFMDVDYPDSATVPINQQAILNGNATPSTVQTFNYNSHRSTLPRYIGSRNSDAEGTNDPGYYYGSVNPELENPFYPAQDRTNLILEFNGGGGTYPEIEKGGAVFITQLISATGPDNVTYTKQKDEGYTNIVNYIIEDMILKILL